MPQPTNQTIGAWEATMASTTSTALKGNYNDIRADEEAVRALVEQGASEMGAVCVMVRDRGDDNARAGIVLGHVFGGGPRTDGTAGNHYTRAMRAMGRDSEIDTGKGSSTKPRSKGLKALIVMEREAIMADAARVGERVDQAEDALTTLDTDAVVAEHIDTLTAQRDEITATIAALKKDPEPYVASVRVGLTAKRDAAKNGVKDAKDAIRTRVAEFEETTGIALEVPGI